MTREVLNSKFNIFVISQEQLDSKLVDSSKYFRINPQEDINIFVLFVKVEQKISIMKRILQREIHNPVKF